MLTEFFTKAPSIVQLIIGLAFGMVVLGWASTLILTIVKLCYLQADERRKQAREERELAREKQDHCQAGSNGRNRSAGDPNPRLNDTWRGQVGHPSNVDPISISTPFWDTALPYGTAAFTDTSAMDGTNYFTLQ